MAAVGQTAGPSASPQDDNFSGARKSKCGESGYARMTDQFAATRMTTSKFEIGLRVLRADGL
jgi:hypothetical protein